MKLNATILAVLIGIGLVFASISVSGNNPFVTADETDIDTVFNMTQPSTPDISPRRENTDHSFVYGDSDADITIIEFSDYECPFCSRLHPTLMRIVDESEGRINWEFRHLPLPSHRNAEFAAFVGECVGKYSGNEAFWEYTDSVFKNQRSVSTDFLIQVAQTLGLEEDVLQSCVADEETKKQIAIDVATARSFGGSGTPFNVILYADGTTQPVSGALPYKNWVQLLNL